MSNTFAVDTARIAEASGDIERIAATIESEVRARRQIAEFLRVRLAQGEPVRVSPPLR